MSSTGMVGPSAMSAQIAIQQAQQTQALQNVNAAKDGDNSAKIDKGAKQFEAMLLSTWLQQAEQSFGSVPGADDDDGEATGRDQMMSLGVQSLAQCLADSGGIGIAKMISKAMHAEVDQTENGVKTGAEHPPAAQIPVRNLSFPLNSGLESADRNAGSEKGSK